MLAAILKQTGLAALGVCLLCSSVEIHDTYRLYVAHEKAREENIHRAYADAMSHGIQGVAVALDASQLAPPATLRKISARAK